MNIVILIGRIGTELFVKKTSEDKSIVEFTLATTEFYKDRNGERQEKTSWVNIKAFDKTADLLISYCSKGVKIGVEGKIQNESWEDDKGNKNYKTVVVVNKIEFLEPKAD